MKYNLRRMLSLILALSMSISLLCVSVWAAETEDAPTEAEDFDESDDSSVAEDELPTEDSFLEEEVVEESITEEAMMAVASASYLDAAWNDTAQKVDFTEKTAESCTTVTSEDTEWTDGWYVVDSNVTVGNRITVTGEVHLILADGAKLTASSGITVTGGNTLKIYGQSGGTGTLDSTSSGSSAIGVGGGWGSPTVGDIVIYGGKVTATGNTGIGYSTTRVNPLTGTLTIYGGTVVASTNADGAGIGGAWNDGGLKTVTVYGGEVTANGGVRAAAIGGGCQNRDNPSSGKGGDVYIYGGTVTAKIKDGQTFGGEGKTPVAIGRGDGGSDDGSITLGKHMVLYGGTSESDLVTIASPYTARYKYMKAVYTPPVASVTSGGTTTEYTGFAAAVSAWNSAGSGATLKLLSDVTTASTIKVTGIRTLDLNGHGITKTGGDNVIWITGGNLTVNDSDTTTTHYFNVNNGIAVNVNAASGEKSFHGGYITGGTGHSYNGIFGGDGGGVYLDGGSFTLNGGTILGNSTGGAPNYNDNGGGVEIYSGTMTMNGGTICYNSSGIGLRAGSSNNNRGGGATTATFVMNDGVIANNKKRGVIHDWWCYGDDYATFNGGSVINNGDWGISAKYLTIAGSVTVSGNANGVTFASSTAAISDSPVISGNTGANLKVNNGKTINVSGSLSGANIGITMQTPGVFTNSANTDYNVASKFTSDNTSYAIGKNADGQLYLGTACTVTYKVVNGTWSDDTTADKTETVTSGANPANVPAGMKASDGYTGGAWDTDPSGATITEATTFTYTFEEKQPAVVKAAPSANTHTYSGSAQELVSAGTAEGGTMQYALGTDATTAPTDGWATSIPTGTNAGSYTVWYKVIGDANHTDTDSASVSVTIGKKEVGLSWSDTSFTYDGQPHIPTATANGLAGSDTCDVTAEGGQTDAGTYTATATALSNTNYKLPSANTTSFTIEKKEVGLSWSNTSFTYDGANHQASATATGLVDGDTCTVTVEGAQTNANIGNATYTATATGLSNSNYKLPDDVTQSFTITPKPVTVTPDALSTAYGQDIPPLTFTVDGLVSDSDRDSLKVKLSTSATKNSPTGTYSITGEQEDGASTNYAVTIDQTKEYTINEADAVISASAWSGTYDGQGHSITVSVIDSRDEENILNLIGRLYGAEPEQKAEATIYYSTVSTEEALAQKSTENPAFTDVGTTTVYYTVVFGGNYKTANPVTGSQTVTIMEREIGLSWSGTNFTYDGAEHLPTATAIGLVEGDTCTVTVEGQQIDTGSYTATATELGNPNYKLPTEATGSFTIAPQEVGLSWSDTSFTYDGESHQPSATATGLVEGDTCTITVIGEQTNAGTYTATASALSNDNYKLPDNYTTSFTIDKADPGAPQVTMQGYTYGGTLPTPGIGDYQGGAVTYYYSTSDSNSGGTEWTDSMSATSLDAGTYYMYAVIASTENYLGYTTQTTRFEIAPGVVTVSGSINFGNFSGNLTLSLLSSDGKETVASDSIRVSGGSGTYHFAHITQGRYILRAKWSEGGIENVLNDEIEIR